MSSLSGIFIDIKLCYLAWKVRQDFQRLKAIRNEEKIKRGLPVKQNKQWITICCGICSMFCSIICFPITLLLFITKCKCFTKIFCPYKRKSKSRKGLLSIFENKALKRIFLFFIGLVISWISFSLMFYYANADRYYASVIGLILLFLLSFGLAYSEKIRVLTLVAIPTMFASTGRFIILGTIFVMVYQGPAANLVLNVDTTGQSMSCGYNEAKREADEFKRDLVKQFEKATLFARKVKNNLMRFVNKVKQAARAVGTAVKKVKTELEKVADYFRGAGKVCQFIENALDYDMLRWIHKLTPCYLVKQATEKVLKLIKFVVKPLVDQVKYEFNVTIELDQDFAFNQQVSTTYDKVFTNVRHEAAQQFIWLTRLVSAVRYLAYIMPFIAILRAIIYLRSYKKKDHYDNTYLSKHMFDIDLARLRQGKETIFPLSQYERIQVIDSFNLRLTTFEFRKLIIAGTFFMISALNAMLYIGLDYLMYGALQLFLFIQSAVTYEQKVAPKFSVSATGSSPLAQMYDFGGGNTVEFTVEDDKLSSCLPDASEPDYEEYKLIFSLLLITFISVITEAYTLRLRHKSCDFYFPRKAKVRAAWLYNQVIQRRGTFLRFLKRQVDNTIGYQAVEKVSVLDRLGATVPCFAFLRRITGHEVKFCIICGKQGAVGDMKGFKHCFSTPKCTGIYCNQCVEDIQNVCSICIEPIQLIYGDSDTSEELNSSDEGSDYYAEDEHVGDELVELFPLRAKMKRIGRKFLMDGIQPERDSSDDEVDFSEERDTGQLLEAFNQELGLETREIERMKKNARLVLDKNHTLQ